MGQLKSNRPNPRRRTCDHRSEEYHAKFAMGLTKFRSRRLSWQVRSKVQESKACFSCVYPDVRICRTFKAASSRARFRSAHLYEACFTDKNIQADGKRVLLQHQEYWHNLAPILVRSPMRH